MGTGAVAAGGMYQTAIDKLISCLVEFCMSAVKCIMMRLDTRPAAEMWISRLLRNDHSLLLRRIGIYSTE